MEPYVIVRCPAHKYTECWILRRYQEATNSYVFEHSHEDLEELKLYTAKRFPTKE